VLSLPLGELKLYIGVDPLRVGKLSCYSLIENVGCGYAVAHFIFVMNIKWKNKEEGSGTDKSN